MFRIIISLFIGVVLVGEYFKYFLISKLGNLVVVAIDVGLKNYFHTYVDVTMRELLCIRNQNAAKAFLWTNFGNFLMTFNKGQGDSIECLLALLCNAMTFIHFLIVSKNIQLEQ